MPNLGEIQVALQRTPGTCWRGAANRRGTVSIREGPGMSAEGMSRSRTTGLLGARETNGQLHVHKSRLETRRG